jgi:hypothetical protein
MYTRKTVMTVYVACTKLDRCIHNMRKYIEGTYLLKYNK